MRALCAKFCRLRVHTDPAADLGIRPQVHV